MTAPQPRTCAHEGCERSTAWPTDPALIAAYCREHTDALLIGPPDTRPEWLHRLKARDETGAVMAR
jgi:hypothetical protein